MNRVCRKCHEDLPLDRFDEYKPGHYRWACFSCRKKPYLKGTPVGGKPGVAPNGEVINAELAAGRTCLDCHYWRDKKHFRVVPSTGNLHAYCLDCMNRRCKDKYHEEKSRPGYMERRIDQNKRSKAKLKQDVITAYGGACACCAEARIEFLTLDHANDDGAEHRKTEGISTGAPTWAYARKHGYPDIFQLLCWNCNCAKAIYGQCPHSIS